MANYLIILVQTLSRVLNLVILIDVVISYFLSPYHPFRATLDKIIEPLLNPIRRRIPAVSGIDFSPLILLILIQILEFVLVSILARF
jgi:YggT family protein